MEYQERLLTKHGYKPLESEEFVLFVRDVPYDSFTLRSTIEIFPNENPDNFSYRGLLSALSPDGDTLMDWDSERKYRLLDVIVSCERIERLINALIKQLDRV